MNNEFNLDDDEFKEVISYILRKEAMKQGKLEVLRHYISEVVEANNK